MEDETETRECMNAATLKQAYEAQLLDAINYHRQRNDEADIVETAALLRASKALPAGELRTEEHGRIWLWSDLHLGHAASIHAFKRPFWTPEEMDDAIFGAWHETVEESDTIVCLGDTACEGLSGRRLQRLNEAPGGKILVLGNHDVRADGDPDVEGFDEVRSTLYTDGEPPLLLTHIPLYRVPEGCVNVHGHIHDRRAEGVLPKINLSVEQIEYRPVALEAVRLLAAPLAAEVTVPGETTGEQLRRVRRR